jgi:serine/threonine protein kinase
MIARAGALGSYASRRSARRDLGQKRRGSDDLPHRSKKCKLPPPSRTATIVRSIVPDVNSESGSESEEDVVLRRANARVGCVLGNKWRLERLLGIGGMASVYAGTHRNGKRGAIKVLHLELSFDRDARRRFLQEGYVANRVEHPGVVSVLDDAVDDDGSVFLVMDLLEGRTVEETARAQPGRRLGAGEVLAIADALLDVLAAAHDKGIVHRDIKPDNLFITREGALKVLDFGIARIRELQSKTHATRAGHPMGTPAYMAPEQALGNWDEVDARTDLWAAGATLFTLLTGRLVHQASEINHLLLAAMTKRALPIRSVLPDLPAQIAAIIDRALEFDRDRRWPDARSMQRAVREVQATFPGAALPPPSARALPPASIGARDALSQPSLVTTLLKDPALRGAKTALGRPILGAAAALATALFVTVLVLQSRPGPDAPPSSVSAGATDALRAAPSGTPAGPSGASAPGATASPAIAPAPDGDAGAPVRAPSGHPVASAPPGTAKGKAGLPPRPAPAKPQSGDPFGKWE